MMRERRSTVKSCTWLFALVAGCGSSGGAGGGVTPLGDGELPSIVDLASAPEMSAIPDLSASSDLGDLASSPDLTSQDLAVGSPDLTSQDLTVAPDLGPTPLTFTLDPGTIAPGVET